MDFGQLLSGLSQYGSGPQTTMADFNAPAAAAPAATGFSGLSTNQLMGSLGAMNFLSNLVSQRNELNSGQSLLNANAFMTDFGIGRNAWDTAVDTRRQKEGAAWPFGFRVDNPKYRQDQLRANLPIAGTSRWGAFMI